VRLPAITDAFDVSIRKKGGDGYSLFLFFLSSEGTLGAAYAIFSSCKFLL